MSASHDGGSGGGSGGVSKGGLFEGPIRLSEAFDPVPKAQWRETVERDLKGAPFERKLVTSTYEGIDIQPLYTADDWPSAGGSAWPSAFSGVAPFARGGTPLDSRSFGWDVRQEHRDPRLDRLNRLILDDLENGVGSILLRLDLAGRRGLDADDPRAGQLVGRDGASISTVDDLNSAFEGVHLHMIGIALESGAAFGPAASLLTELYDRRGTEAEAVRAHFNADPLAVLARDGFLPMALDDAMGQMARLAAWTSANLPNAKSVRVGSAPLHHAGATAVQDLAFSMATGVAYLRALTAEGLSVEEASRQLLFSYAIGCHQFLAIAKLRAARKLWARVIEACGGGVEAQRMAMHVRTSKRVITSRDPWVNMLRNTICAFSAGVCGAEVITTGPYDEAIGLPSPHTRRIARNTQTILMEESHIHRVTDPAGGCWFIEHLTDEIAEKAWAMFREIERRGGMAECLESGWVSEQIDSAFAPRARDIATRKEPITGVSEFPNLAEEQTEPEPVNFAQLLGQRRRTLLEFKKGRGDVGSIAGDPGAMRAASAKGATLGELAQAISTGEGAALPSPITPHPYAAPFEELREASDAYLAQCGFRPRVFLANLGPVAAHTARAGFAKNFFEAGGFEVLANNGFKTADEAAAAMAESGASIAVICSSDEMYGQMAEETARALRSAGARSVVLAGNPGENEERYRAAGIDRFIFMKCDVLGVLRELAQEEGVL